MAPSWDEKAVFLAALALPAEDRASFLDGACPTPQARERIVSLLATLDEGVTATVPASSVGQLQPSDPASLDEFEIVRRLGQGGMGIVYLAQDTLLQRSVAIKVLADHLTGSDQALGRFKDEAKLAASLKNPGIVPVHKFGCDNGRHYIVSEYVPGHTLKELLAAERDRRSETQTSGEYRREWRRRMAGIASRIAEALEHSHRASVVHRDVKPSNILVDTSDSPRLTDFGIAKHLAAGPPGDFTRGIGSCHYMSPEQAAVSEVRVDGRSDIFSLGVVLYEALALRRPFDGDTPEQVLHAVRSLDPVPLKSADPGIPRDLATICETALEKDPSRRYQSALHMAADLRCFLEGKPIMARGVTVARRARRFAAANRGVFTAGVIVALAVAFGLTSWFYTRSRHAALGWMSVESTPSGLWFTVHAVNPATHGLDPQASISGRTPARSLKVRPGQYRVTVGTDDHGSFAEFNALLVAPGPGNHLSLLARTPDAVDALAATAYDRRILRATLYPTSRVVSEDMIQVEAGTYEFGWANSAIPEIGRRDIHVDSFFIDRTPVSNAQYKAFIDATGHPAPQAWTDYGYEAAAPDLPVVGVTFHDAESYARWVGKRLPTAPEWQASARGPDRRRYPWGHEHGPARTAAPSASDIVLEQSWDPRVLYDLYARHAVSALADDGQDHPAGLRLMFGPLRECTGSFDTSLDGVLIVGRAWTDSPSTTDMTRIYSYPHGNFSFKHGFRCAKSATPFGTPAIEITPGRTP